MRQRQRQRKWHRGEGPSLERESFSLMNETRHLESHMSSWHLYFFFFLRYSFIASFTSVSFAPSFFVFRLLGILSAFHSMRTIPLTPFRRISC